MSEKLLNRWQTLSNRTQDVWLLLGAMALTAALRVPGLTVFLTADEARSWFGRSIIFLDSLLRGNLANTGPGGTVPYIQNVSLSPAPGVTTMWTGAIGIVLEYVRQGAPGSLADFLVNIPFDPLDPAILTWLRLPGVLTAVLAVGLTYWWGRPLLGRLGAFVAAAFLALGPFYLALSRVLGHDALVTTFMWLSLLALLRAIESVEFSVLSSKSPVTSSKLKIQNSKLWLFISGAMAGLAWLSKYPALFIGAFAALTLLLVYLWQARAVGTSVVAVLKRWLVDMLLWSLAAGVVFALFWPAMWVDPLGPVATIINDALRASGSAHQKGSFFLGRPVPDPGLLFYPIVAVFRTTPVVLLGALLSLWLLFKPRPLTPNAKLDARWLLFILWSYVILYTVLVTIGGKKQDRYLLPVFPAIAMLAALGYTYLLAAAQGRSRPLRWAWILPVSLLVIQFLMVLPYYPYYFSYYNPFAGGGLAAAKTIQVGWGEGLNEAAAYLNTRPDGRTAKVTSWYSTTFEPYFNGQAIYKIEDEKISRSAKPGLAADYVVFYINQVQRRLPSDGALAYFQRHDPVHTVYLNGQPYAWIYRAPGLPHIISGEARLVGQAELLGFEWLDAAGRRLEAIPSNSVAELRLYWEWQGKSPDDPIGVSLVDDAEQTVGWGNLIEPGRPITNTGPLDAEAGAIVISRYALAVFPGTPPGRYHLRAWIDRPDTGEVVGRFPLEPADAQVTVAPPLTPATAADFEINRPVNANFGPLRLLGYNFDSEPWPPGETRQLELFWALPSGQTPDHDAQASLTLSPQTAGLPAEAAAAWARPVTPGYPTGQWQPGDHYRDLWPLSLPPAQPKGRYNLQLTIDGVTQTLGQVEVSGRERLFKAPPLAHSLNAMVGDSIKLLGFEVLNQPDAVQVTLLWQAGQTPPADYTVFVQLLDANNQVVAQHDSPPQNGAAPTGQWAPGEFVLDEHRLALPAAGVTGGSYRLIAGMYRPADGQRLPIETESGRSDAITLATIELK